MPIPGEPVVFGTPGLSFPSAVVKRSTVINPFSQSRQLARDASLPELGVVSGGCLLCGDPDAGSSTEPSFVEDGFFEVSPASDGPHSGAMRFGHWENIDAPWVLQKATMYMEGWTRPRCTGGPDTWMHRTVEELFKVQNGSTASPGANVKTGKTRVDVSDSTSWDFKSGYLVGIGSTRGGDVQGVAFPFESCDLCVFRFTIATSWCPATLGSSTVSDVDYIQYYLREACKGCLCGHMRPGIGGKSRSGDVHIADSSAEGKGATLKRRVKPKPAGAWQHDGYTMAWDICPCSERPGPPPTAPPGPPPPPHGPITGTPGAPPAGGPRKPRVQFWRGHPNNLFGSPYIPWPRVFWPWPFGTDLPPQIPMTRGESPGDIPRGWLGRPPYRGRPWYALSRLGGAPREQIESPRDFVAAQEAIPLAATLPPVECDTCSTDRPDNVVGGEPAVHDSVDLGVPIGKWPSEDQGERAALNGPFPADGGHDEVLV